MFCGATWPLRTGMVPLQKLWWQKIFGRPSEKSKPVPQNAFRQVLAGDNNRSQRGSPFSLSPVSHPRTKISPPLVSVFFFFLPRPPVFPLFQLRRVPGWAHLSRRFPALLADVKLERKESVSRSFTNISPSLLESAVRVCGGAWEWMLCVRVCAWGSIVVEGEDGWLSEANGWEAGGAERGAAPTRRREEPTWMRRQSGRRR